MMSVETIENYGYISLEPSVDDEGFQHRMWTSLRYYSYIFVPAITIYVLDCQSTSQVRCSFVMAHTFYRIAMLMNVCPSLRYVNIHQTRLVPCLKMNAKASGLYCTTARKDLPLKDLQEDTTTI